VSDLHRPLLAGLSGALRNIPYGIFEKPTAQFRPAATSGFYYSASFDDNFCWRRLRNTLGDVAGPWVQGGRF